MHQSDRHPKRVYEAIGRFIYEFSQAEYAIRYHLAEEIGLDDRFFSEVVESYDVGMLCTVAVKVFCKTRARLNATEIEKLIGKFRGINVRRNIVAHGLWVPHENGGRVHYVPRNLKPQVEINQAEILSELADETCKLRAELERAFLGPSI
ncbi:MAG: hypothetical protein KGJ85_08695 [Betaproteobacteria bacterium]|nr:hypothetical protein [Betaproteobacteria bacterium]